jgi:signal transduction histidine kinase
MQTQPARIIHDVGTRLEALLKGYEPEKIDVSLYELEQHRDLASVANQLIETFDEIQRFILPLSQGKLGEFSPRKGNVLASPFKELHAQLKHLTWQTQRIAEGDFRQRVDFMGEFSLAFNAMVEKLAQREAQLASAKAELEQMVEELRRSNEQLEQFAYVVSHDLKAPLRGIRTLAEWLMADLGDRLGEEGNENMRLLVGRADRMQDLINGILEYSRIGRVREDHSLVRLNELVPQVLEDLSPPPHVLVDIDAKLPTVCGEPTRIRQLFQNLLSNAIKYMDKKHGLIRVECTEERNAWRFFVSDNGPGIDEKHFDHIFKIFQTLTPRDTTESTGVGLTVAKRIVELHGGEIHVESQLGVGATFVFTWPKARTEATDVRCQISAAR